MSSCLAFHGLDRSPFAEPGLVLATRPLRAGLERVRSLVSSGARGVCVTGPEGVGRSSLARVVARELAARRVRVIDDAQGLPAEVLREALADGHPVVLFARSAADGGPEGEGLREALAEVAAPVVVLEPLAPGELHRYLCARLERVGGKDPLFSEAAARVLHRLTGGAPGPLGSLCQHLVAESARLGVHRIDAHFVSRVAGGAPHPARAA